MENKKIYQNINLSDHAFLLVMDYDSNPCDVINDIFTQITLLKSQENNCDLSNILKLLINRKYDDLIWLNCQNENLRKENIIEIKERFSYPSNNIIDLKFYIIENIENSSISSLNSLLKFLEEPTPNTYAIFTTSNRNKILNTIISRCKILRINKDESLLSQIFYDNNLDDFQKKIYSNLFYNIDELMSFLKDSNFSIINNIIKDLCINKDSVIFFKNWEIFKKMEYYYIEIIIKAIYNYYSDNNIKEKLIILLDSLKYNINKNLIYFKILEIIK